MQALLTPPKTFNLNNGSRYSHYTQCPVCTLYKTRRAFKGDIINVCSTCEKKEIPHKNSFLHYYMDGDQGVVSIDRSILDETYALVASRISQYTNLATPVSVSLPETPKKLPIIRLPRLSSDTSEETKHPEPSSPNSEPIPSERGGSPGNKVPKLRDQMKALQDDNIRLQVHISQIYGIIKNQTLETHIGAITWMSKEIEELKKKILDPEEQKRQPPSSGFTVDTNIILRVQELEAKIGEIFQGFDSIVTGIEDITMKRQRGDPL